MVVRVDVNNLGFDAFIFQNFDALYCLHLHRYDLTSV